MPICWSQSGRFLEIVDIGSEETERAYIDKRAYCYMLSNHSLPRSQMCLRQLLAAPTLLGCLLRTALHVLGYKMSTSLPNYLYWQTAGLEWESVYRQRKKRHPYLHIAEMMITDYIMHHAPCQVLEWGCGTGRHLRNLLRLPGVEVFGHDQSDTMLQSGLRWASDSWKAQHVTVGAPTAQLPYADCSFDIVFTCEALLHTRPEDLEGPAQRDSFGSAADISYISNPIQSGWGIQRVIMVVGDTIL